MHESATLPAPGDDGGPRAASAESLSELWDQNAASRAAELDEGVDEAYKALTSICIDALELRGTRGRVLDAGCGVGALTDALARAGRNPVGIDPSITSIDWARRRFPGLELECLSIEAFARQWESAFEAVIANMVLHTAPDLDSFTRSSARVTRPGGLFLATLPHPAFYLFGKAGLDWVDAVYGTDDCYLIPFRIRSGRVHPARVPYFQRTIERYSESLYLAGYRDVHITEPAQVGKGRPFDVLVISGTR